MVAGRAKEDEVITLGLALYLAAGVPSVPVSGAGATSVKRVVGDWTSAYAKETGTTIRYEAVGSGDGLRRVAAGQVAFAITDTAVSVQELSEGGLVQFPLVLDGIVPVVNLPAVQRGMLRLDGPTLAALFQGRITVWNAPEIRKLNPNLTLPVIPVRVVHRADRSGSTAVFSAYLAKVSPEWRTARGAGLTVAWPSEAIPTRSSDEMAEAVARTPGAIGYVDFSRVRDGSLTPVQLQNRSGRFVAPSASAFRYAAAAVAWEQAPGLSVTLLDQSGPEAWPVTSVPYVVMKKASDAQIVETLRFFDWVLRSGGSTAERAGLASLPAPLVRIVQAAWEGAFHWNGSAIITGGRRGADVAAR